MMNIRMIAIGCLFMAGLVNAQEKEAPMVKLETSAGDIVLELYPDKAPETVTNFLMYVDNKFYDGTIFHRVIRNFMIQGGGFDASLSRKQTQSPIRNEAANALKNNRGTIAMARTSIPDSATSQFFINTVNNDSLNFRDPSPMGIGYCVFGRVIEGMDVVDAIQNTKTSRQAGMGDVPVETVTIKQATRIKQAESTEGDD